ncbi:MAG TPA: biotin carboxylase N-terminal domain-containing protein [Acidimicrobiia bacterium]|nr:biotin carboxylase N-terminal domain-containing protein [Acidimicrobiia bacterium]
MTRVLVANRGAVAARVIRALDALGWESVAVFSDADAGAPYLERATTAMRIGPPPPLGSYLDQDAVLRAAARTGADAVHPGYGFLSEDARFARRVTEAGLGWIGPSPDWIERMGHKGRARTFAAEHDFPLGPASGILPPGDREAAHRAAGEVGYPLLVKPAAGGGGIGMTAVGSPDELVAAVERASSLAARGFGSAEVYLERMVARPRHVEFQIVADRHGAARHLFERDCSIQRRHQKLIEEAPAPGLDRGRLDPLADRLAAALGRAGYDNIGTVEMLDDEGSLQFLEMNTRLQVEHGVTEELTGIDLVVSQIRLAAGDRLADVLPEAVRRYGHAIEARVYAEDPVRFFPSPGTLEIFRPPHGVRVETGYAEGGEVTVHYDPLLAKVIVHADDRAGAIERLAEALESFVIEGVRHNVPALLALLRSDQFGSGEVHTGLTADVVPAQRGAVAL